jgi:hypothetical protein
MILDLESLVRLYLAWIPIAFMIAVPVGVIMVVSAVIALDSSDLITDIDRMTEEEVDAVRRAESRGFRYVRIHRSRGVVLGWARDGFEVVEEFDTVWETRW